MTSPTIHTAEVEAFYNGAWNALPIRTEDGLGITRGGQAGLTRVSPQAMTFSILNDEDGTYTLNNPYSDLYGLIGPNTRVRGKIDGDFRMYGELESWPTRWTTEAGTEPDESRGLIYCAVCAYGPLRRLGGGGTKVTAQSALTRYVAGNSARRAYWPLDDGANTLEGRAYQEEDDPIVVTYASGAGMVKFAAGQLGPWLPLGVDIKDSVVLTSGSILGADSTAFAADVLIKVTGIPDSDDIIELQLLAGSSDGDTYSVVCSFIAAGSSTMVIKAGVTTLDTDSGTPADTVWDGQLHHLRVMATEVGGNVTVTAWLDGVEILNGSDVGRSVVAPWWSLLCNELGGLSVGHAIIWAGASIPAASAVYEAAVGHVGESAVERLIRLAGEEDLDVIVPSMNLAHDPRATANGTSAGKLTWSPHWYGDGGGAGVTSLVTGGSGPTGTGITTYIRKTWSVAPTSNGDTGFSHSPGWAFSSTQGYPVDEGRRIMISGWLRSSASSKVAKISIYWHTASGAQTLDDQAASEQVTLTANVWQRITRIVTVPAGMTTMTASVNIGGGGTLWANGNTLDGTGLMVCLWDRVPPYRDGASTGWQWLGTTNDSQSVADTELMGPQRTVPVIESLYEAGDADGGILGEDRYAFALRYRTRADLYDQPVQLALSLATEWGQVVDGLAPVPDTLNVRNDITVERYGGGKLRDEQATGQHNTGDPGSDAQAAGRYEYLYQLNLESDDQLAAQVAYRLTLGTVKEERYPSIPVDCDILTMHSATDPLKEFKDLALARAVNADMGDRIWVDDVPPWAPEPNMPIDQIIYGSVESCTAGERLIEFTTEPAAPYLNALNPIIA